MPLRRYTYLAIVLAFGTVLPAADKHPKSTPSDVPEAIYVEPQNGFESYIQAAFFKKHVPATIANDKQSATLVLRSGNIVQQEEKTGLGKLARCAWALCIGIDGTQTVSVQLTIRLYGRIASVR